MAFSFYIRKTCHSECIVLNTFCKRNHYIFCKHLKEVVANGEEDINIQREHTRGKWGIQPSFPCLFNQDFYSWLENMQSLNLKILYYFIFDIIQFVSHIPLCGSKRRMSWLISHHTSHIHVHLQITPCIDMCTYKLLIMYT